MDPLSKFRDEQIWAALFACRINILVDLLGGLDSELNENGDELSIGQRHLFGLARAVLNNCDIICMDEITANIDNETGQILNELMQTVFRTKTVLHIAHKIDAIREFDRIMVLNEGSIVQMCSMEQYLSQPNKDNR